MLFINAAARRLRASVTPLKRFLASLMVLTLMLSGVQQAQAAMIGNAQLLQQVERQQVVALFDRADLQQQLAQLGVDPEQAKARVAAMSDADIATLNRHLADQPAGEGFLGLAFMVFVLFVVTDMLGATDVFPFVKNINR